MFIMTALCPQEIISCATYCLVSLNFLMTSLCLIAVTSMKRIQLLLWVLVFAHETGCENARMLGLSYYLIYVTMLCYKTESFSFGILNYVYSHREVMESVTHPS